MEGIGHELSAMIYEIRNVAESDLTSDELSQAAEVALTSLLKSAAIYGFNVVDGAR